MAEDQDTPHDADAPAVAPRMAVYDNDARFVGVVSRIAANPRTGKVTDFTVRYRFPHGRDLVVIPASMVAHIGDRLVLKVSEAELKAQPTVA